MPGQDDEIRIIDHPVAVHIHTPVIPRIRPAQPYLLIEQLRIGGVPPAVAVEIARPRDSHRKQRGCPPVVLVVDNYRNGGAAQLRGRAADTPARRNGDAGFPLTFSFDRTMEPSRTDISHTVEGTSGTDRFGSMVSVCRGTLRGVSR